MKLFLKKLSPPPNAFWLLIIVIIISGVSFAFHLAAKSAPIMAAPSIISIAPEAGPVVGGQEVTITGSGFGQQLLATGYYFNCSVNLAGKAYCWGQGEQGQLGDGIGQRDGNVFVNNGGLVASNVPVAVDTSGVLAGKTIKQLGLGIQHACVVASDDQAYCWGSGGSGQLGNGVGQWDTNINGFSSAGVPVASNVPVAVDTSGVLAGKTIKQIVTSDHSTCAIASDDQAYCWGLSFTSGAFNNVPEAVDTTGALAGKTIKQITMSVTHICVIASDDQAYCWGNGSNGQLGNGTTYSNVPVAVDTSGVLAGKTIKQLALSLSHTCVIASDDQVYCWGLSYTGYPTSSVPVAVDTSGVLAGKTIKQLDVAMTTTCVIASDDQVYCWGLGHGSNPGAVSFVPVAVDTSGALAGKTIKQLFAKSTNNNGPTCVIASDDQAYCWRTGSFGQLGNGTTTSYSNVPVAVDTSGALAGKIITQLNIGQYHVCAMSADDQVYCWGSGNLGQLGDGTGQWSGGAFLNNGALVASNVPVAVDNIYYAPSPPTAMLGTASCTNVRVLSDTQFKCITSAHTAQVVDVTAMSVGVGIQGVLENGYEYVGAASTPVPTPVVSTPSSDGGSSPTIPSAPQCQAGKPTDPAPYITHATGGGTGSITLHYQLGGKPYTKYLVEYGYSDAGFSFGATIDHPDTGSFTINDLSPGTTYNFRLIPMNDCAGGAPSNTFPVTVGGLPRVPGVPNTGH